MMAVSLLLAAGLGYGSVQFGKLAFGHHDAAPESIALTSAASQPENKWAMVRGRIDPGTLLRASHALGRDLVAFRLNGAGTGLVVLTSVARHPVLADESLWQPGLLERLTHATGDAPAGKPLQEATVHFLTEEQTFTGVITEPGSGMNKEDHVELDGERFKVTGLIGSYCGHVGGCPAGVKVLLVGETPRGRLGMLAATAGLVLLTLAFFAIAFKRPTA
jgi:hypothetical protein